MCLELFELHVKLLDASIRLNSSWFCRMKNRNSVAQQWRWHSSSLSRKRISYWCTRGEADFVTMTEFSSRNSLITFDRWPALDAHIGWPIYADSCLTVFAPHMTLLLRWQLTYTTIIAETKRAGSTTITSPTNDVHFTGALASEWVAVSAMWANHVTIASCRQKAQQNCTVVTKQWQNTIKSHLLSACHLYFRGTRYRYGQEPFSFNNSITFVYPFRSKPDREISFR